MIPNKIIKYIFVCLLVISTGCGTPDIAHVHPHTGIKDQLSNEISLRVMQKLMKEHELMPCGFGGGAINQIEMLALSFDYHKPLTIEEGRKLILIAVHALTDAVNADERIRPYLIEYPFGPQRVEIRIFVRDIKENSLRDSEADIFTCCDGICRYKKMNDAQNNLTILLQETVEEAENKIRMNI